MTDTGIADPGGFDWAHSSAGSHESEMVERVARAICANESGMIPDRLYEDDLSGPPKELLPGWKFYVHSAIAAIEAMRKPTLKMLDANQGNWNAAIDEALRVDD